MTGETLVQFGDSVKALGDGKVGGYLVRFSSANDPDLTGDYFTASTDYEVDDWDTAKSFVYYAHAQDQTLKARKLGKASYKVDEVGIWVESQLELRDDYEKAVYQLAKDGKLGWSSGSSSHLVERKSIGNAYEITHWPLVEASLTPNPAEPRNAAVTSLKNLQIDFASEVKPLAGRSLEDHFLHALAAVKDYADRAKGLSELKAKDGRDLSDKARTLISDTASAIESIAIELKALATPNLTKDNSAALYAEFEALCLDTLGD